MVDMSVLNVAPDSGKEIDIETRSFEPIPEGVYDFELTDSRIKRSQKAGQYLEMEMTCMDENYMNRKVWAKFFFQSEKAAPKANRDWMSLLEAIKFNGDPANCDTESLHGSLLGVQLSLESNPNYANGEPQNVVKDFLVSAKANAPVQHPAPAQPSGARPWAKG